MSKVRPNSMDIIFLDQNKWIDLARVEAGVCLDAELIKLYDELVGAVESGLVIFPLTVSHILETSKRNDSASRGHVATVQARLSRGYVFRSRKARLLVEMRLAQQKLFGDKPFDFPNNWVIAPGFMQAFEVFDEMVASPEEAHCTRLINQRINPEELFLDYMQNQDDESRRTGHVAFAAESSALVARIEQRRLMLNGESLDLRRRAYSAQLFFDHQDYVIHVLDSIGRTVDETKAKGADAVINFLRDVPTLNIEAEIASRLEAQPGALKENDIRDMLSFYTALPYATRIVGEKVFIALTKQANLDKKYGTSLHKSLVSLLGVYVT